MADQSGQAALYSGHGCDEHRYIAYCEVSVASAADGPYKPGTCYGGSERTEGGLDDELPTIQLSVLGIGPSSFGQHAAVQETTDTEQPDLLRCLAIGHETGVKELPPFNGTEFPHRRGPPPG